MCDVNSYGKSPKVKIKINFYTTTFDFYVRHRHSVSEIKTLNHLIHHSGLVSLAKIKTKQIWGKLKKSLHN